MFIEGADSTLFDASILDFKGDSGFGKINELMDYIRRIQFVLQNSKAESQFLLCSSSIPESLNQYTFDSVNPEMLQRAEIIENDLVFASDRRYATVVFSDEMLRSGPGKEIALALKAKGVRVSGLTGEPGDDAEAHNKLHESLNINALGAIRNLPELLPALTWRSDQGQIDIRFMHRSDAARDFYLIKNESDAAGMVTLTFTASEYSGISRWQPLDGKIYEINQFTRPDKLHTSIPTLVRPGELFFMVFSRP
jgi:hypothetical protein